MHTNGMLAVCKYYVCNMYALCRLCVGKKIVISLCLKAFCFFHPSRYPSHKSHLSLTPPLTKDEADVKIEEGEVM